MLLSGYQQIQQVYIINSNQFKISLIHIFSLKIANYDKFDLILDFSLKNEFLKNIYSDKQEKFLDFFL